VRVGGTCHQRHDAGARRRDCGLQGIVRFGRDPDQACSEVIRPNPRDTEAYFKRGWAYRESWALTEVKFLDLAMSDFNKAIELNPRMAEYFLGRASVHTAWVYSRSGDDFKKHHERAVADLTKAIELNANYARAYGERGYAYLQLDDKERAIADFKKAVSLDPSDSTSKAYLKSLGVTM
jgi:tetratricopeptide (TPR) repeat protein